MALEEKSEDEGDMNVQYFWDVSLKTRNFNLMVAQTEKSGDH